MITMPDRSEVVEYNHADIPFYIRPGLLSSYPGMRALIHWHEDLEWIVIRKGQMSYQINQQHILLQEGDCLLVNSRQLHYGYSADGQDCDFLCLLFLPRLLTSNSYLYEHCIQPALENPDFTFLQFHAQEALTETIRPLLYRMESLEKEQAPGFELGIIGSMDILWGILLKNTVILSSECTHPKDPDLFIQREMVSYIYRNYTETITLADIAAAGSVCISKCCSLFKRYSQQSPISFLNRYRLEVSCHLLKNTNRSITHIALSCGFNHLSYYSRLFLRTFGCTPGEYRKRETGL